MLSVRRRQVDEAVLLGFSVAAADEGLIAVLEVMATDDVRVLHSTLDEAPESPGPFGLVGAGSRTTGSHAAIGAAEIERTDQNRFVYDAAAIATGDELSGTVCVNIDGKDIGVAGGGFPDVRRLSKALERAGEKEFLRREGFDGLSADSEIAVEPFAAEEDGIGPIALSRNGVAQLREFLPDPETGTPSGIQRRKREVAETHVPQEFGFCRTSPVGLREQFVDDSGEIFFVVHAVSEAHGIFERVGNRFLPFLHLNRLQHPVRKFRMEAVVEIGSFDHWHFGCGVIEEDQVRFASV